ncbi:XIAP-associated factor 1 isoform X3 [Macrotis lagotis]|uniref:XIAP-associated factor 1 isoform X3 n=1 Tax=Macrotis lagotis TaxID=92651 RepID=UPI003D69F551
MEEDLQLCTNCEKKVPSTYFHLHEAHCLKFRTICPECKEVILKKELKDHQENGHKQVQCKLCQQTMKKYLLEAHEAGCPERPIRCEFCDLAVPLSHLEEHESSCSGQTKTRITCKQPVQQAQQANPENIIRSRPEKSRARALEKSEISAPRKKVSCPECWKDISEAKFPQHQVTRSQPLRGQKEEEYDVLEGCSHCHILLPLPVLRQHKEKCQRLTMEPWKILKQRIPDGAGKSQTGRAEVL